MEIEKISATQVVLSKINEGEVLTINTQEKILIVDINKRITKLTAEKQRIENNLAELVIKFNKEITNIEEEIALLETYKE